LRRRGQTIVTPQDILTFWFVEAGADRWYKKSDAFDADIRRKFEDTAISLAADGSSWEAAPESTLALIIVLDQFSRNMYRGTLAAFAWDDKALRAAQVMVDKGWDLKIPQDRREFIYMPFMHAENIAAQNDCVRLVASRLNDVSTLHHAEEHRKLIKRFGRFPHRNAMLGRASTQDEENFLKQGGYRA